jgi:hypothetical protein
MALETILIWRKVDRLSRVFNDSGRNCLQGPGKLTEDIYLLLRRNTVILLIIKNSSLDIYDDSNVDSGLPQNRINDQDVVIFAEYVCTECAYLWLMYCTVLHILVLCFRGKNHIIINLLSK